MTTGKLGHVRSGIGIKDIHLAVCVPKGAPLYFLAAILIAVPGIGKPAGSSSAACFQGDINKRSTAIYGCRA